MVGAQKHWTSQPGSVLLFYLYFKFLILSLLEFARGKLKAQSFMAVQSGPQPQSQSCYLLSSAHHRQSPNPKEPAGLWEWTQCKPSLGGESTQWRGPPAGGQHRNPLPAPWLGRQHFCCWWCFLPLNRSRHVEVPSFTLGETLGRGVKRLAPYSSSLLPLSLPSLLCLRIQSLHAAQTQAQNDPTLFLPTSAFLPSSRAQS